MALYNDNEALRMVPHPRSFRLDTVGIKNVIYSLAAIACLMTLLWTLEPSHLRTDEIHKSETSEQKQQSLPGIGTNNTLATCGPSESMDSRNRWQQTKKKYEHLIDDQFTIVIPSYKRLDRLQKTLEALLDVPIKALYEVVVVWIDIDSTPPSDYVSKHGISVRYRKPPNKSLNVRFLPDEEYATQAVLHQDDDIYYDPKDLDFVFDTWRKYGQGRVVGGTPRCATWQPERGWRYEFCQKHRVKGEITGTEEYSIILTNLAFVHISIMDFYSSDDPQMRQIRDHVTDVFNCEDIAMNFVASMLTCEGPLHVKGAQNYHDPRPSKGISSGKKHFETRSQCIDHFSHVLGFTPLIDQTAHISRRG